MTFTKDNCTGIYKALDNGVCVYNDTSLMNPLSGVSFYIACSHSAISCKVPRNFVKPYILSLTEYAWEFINDALWDSRWHA